MCFSLVSVLRRRTVFELSIPKLTKATEMGSLFGKSHTVTENFQDFHVDNDSCVVAKFHRIW